MCLEDVANAPRLAAEIQNQVSSYQEQDTEANQSSLLASSNADNGAYFNPLK